MRPTEVAIVLNHEESGILCQLLMTRMMETARSPEQLAGFNDRMVALYAKLSHANDILAGKAPADA